MRKNISIVLSIAGLVVSLAVVGCSGGDSTPTTAPTVADTTPQKTDLGSGQTAQSGAAVPKPLVDASGNPR